ncbi:cytochrome-c oxidase, cbb3-type subunit II, partial [Marinomonas sp. 42_23_T18]
LIIVAISFGAMVEIVPLFFMQKTTQPVEGLKPLTALELEGRDIYIREGCVGCHTQMIRPFRAETERYGPYSVAGESVYDHPHLWGSKRTGPDLARVGQRYSDEWHRAHLYNPRDVVPESNMPAFTWLFTSTLDGNNTANKMIALRSVGVPFTDQQITNAKEDVRGKREIDALVAYLQQLGTVIKR